MKALLRQNVFHISIRVFKVDICLDSSRQRFGFFFIHHTFAHNLNPTSLFSYFQLFRSRHFRRSHIRYTSFQIKMLHLGAGSSIVCAGCLKSFKRHATHIALNAACAKHYTDKVADKNRADAGALHSNRSRNNSINTHQNTAATKNDCEDNVGFNSSDQSSSDILPGDDECMEIFVDDILPDDVDVLPDDDNDTLLLPDHDNDIPLPDDDDDVQFDDEDDVQLDDVDKQATTDKNGTVSTDEEDFQQPDESVLKLYEELVLLRANPFGLERFSRDEKIHVELLQLLKDIKAPLKAFSLILNWAAKSNEAGHLFKVGFQPSRNKVISNLYQRYNMDGLIPKEGKLYVPYTKRTMSMVYFDASEVFASLLTCPTLNRDENYLFHDQKNPFAAPSKTADVGDINTGRSYRKTHKSLVKNPDVDIILPCILAMDKTTIDHAGHLQMEPITISHGLLKHNIRSKPIAMRILGYVNHSTPAHIPTEFSVNTTSDGIPPPGTSTMKSPLRRRNNVSWPTYLLNELHMQIRYILEKSGFCRLQNHGFRWNLNYNKQIYPIVFHPYVPFIIGDTEGHDHLCGHYTSRTKNVQQLCRGCECPTLLSGYSKADFPLRRPGQINRLVNRGDLDGLQSLSQKYLKNGFDVVRFGQHNNRGIFGACPGEMLHLISLGWFKYCLEAFSAQAGGPKSLPLKHYDRLCSIVGRRLTRQSDRDLPRTNFPKGFSSGSNLMGHEMAGCLLVKLFALHTTCFRLIFKVGKKEKKQKNCDGTAGSHKDGKLQVLPKLSSDKHVADWILVVSSLLQWHEWMKQNTIPKAQVRKSQYAVRWLMRKVALVSPRATGMGNNTIKTHLVLHLHEDILDHGVPENVNSAYAESAHIPLAKITSRNTQKRVGSFTKQAAHRYIENLAVSLAAADISFDAVTGGGSNRANIAGPEPPVAGRLVGRRFTISWPLGSDHPLFNWIRSGPSDDGQKDRLPQHVTVHLAKHCLPHMPDGKVPCATEFVSAKGCRYRAHPNIYDGEPWNDHAMIKWHGFARPIPALIHTFVDLTGLPTGTQIHIPSSGQPRIGAGTYALVHSFLAIDEDEIDHPNSMIGRYTLFQRVPGNGNDPTLYLVDVESIDSPTIGIQDVGDFKSRPLDEHYLFLIRRKEEWARAWDSMIQSEYESRDDASIEDQYEERLADGRIVLQTITTSEQKEPRNEAQEEVRKKRRRL